MNLRPAVLTNSFSSSSITRGLFGTQGAGQNMGQESMVPTALNVDVVNTTASPLHMESVDVDKDRISFNGQYRETTRALKSWSTSYKKATGIFNPKIAAVVALAIGMASDKSSHYILTAMTVERMVDCGDLPRPNTIKRAQSEKMIPVNKTEVRFCWPSVQR